MNNNRILYERRGRRYVPVAAEWYDRDRMAVGQFRLSYCYADGATRYEYLVRPDNAGWIAASMVARQAIEDAISQAALAQTPHLREYTAKQREIIERYRAEMRDAGALLPDWWQHSSAWELSEAAVEAVRRFRP